MQILVKMVYICCAFDEFERGIVDGFMAEW